MKTIFATCEPRADVLSGELTEEMFAARLRDVIENQAEEVYQDATRFFENTYPTDGLRTLVHEALGRLSGQEPTNSPFIRLETSFGGGKTHNLIALYHLASGADTDAAGDLVPGNDWLPKETWAVAAVVGSDMDPANGIHHGGVTTRTIWGEIAYQLGAFGEGAETAYERMRAADEALIAPGTQVLEEIVGDRPTLIMLDEAARYLRSAKAVSTPNNRSDLAEQTVAFLMTLIEFAASKPHVVVVLTLADSTDAFGRETEDLQQELAEAQKVSARQERVITPTGETEIARIVTHRLFASIDGDAAKETAKAYQDYFKELEGRDADIPETVLRAEYRREMEQDYPFHPELLTTLNRKTATIPNFQKTRGALRLLARVVRRLWDEKPADAWLIAPYHIDLADDAIVNDLTSRLQRPAFRHVIEADIVSPRKGALAHAQTLDEQWVEAGKPPYARRAASSIFLHSLTQGIATGVELPELLVATLQPGDDPEHVRKTLALALGEERGGPGTAFWFLHWDGRLYLFKTEPSLEKVIQDEIPSVGRVRAKDELDQRIQKVWRRGTFTPVYFPAEAADLADDAKEPKLAILHYDACTATADDAEPPDLVRKLFDRAGTMEGYRTYKNNVLFLVPDEDQTERMVGLVQRHLAIRRIVGDSGRLAQFSDEQKKRLKAMDEAAELDVRVAITRACRYLYYPSGDAPQAAGGLSRQTLPAQGQGEVSSDQTAVVLRVLKQLDKVLTADDPPMPAKYVKAKAWPKGQAQLSTEDLRREFGKRIGLKILLDINQLKKTIHNGCKQGDWIYYDAEEQWGYGPNSPIPVVAFSEERILYDPEEGRRLGIRVKGEEEELPGLTCPICGQVECECGAGNGENGDSDVLEFTEEGAPGQVFQRIADRFHDEKKSSIGTLVIRCEGAGREAVADSRGLGLAVPQLPKGEYRVMHRINAEFGELPKREVFSLEFEGGWDRYKRVKSLSDPFGEEASKVNVHTTLSIVFPAGLELESDQFQAFPEVLASLDLGRLSVTVREAAPAEEGVV